VALIVKATGDYENHPEGQFRAVCADVVDLGMVENRTSGKLQHKLALVFHTEEKMRDGRPFEVWERFTASLDERARLRKFLQGWRGRAFSQEELDGFDVEKLIGVPAYIQVLHVHKNGKTYANVETAMLPPKGTPKVEVTPGYERRKDRQPTTTQAVPADSFETMPPALEEDEDDSGLPF
jgi:hypothetical protein